MIDTDVRAVAVVKQNEALVLHRGFIYAYIQFMSPEYRPAASNCLLRGSLSNQRPHQPILPCICDRFVKHDLMLDPHREAT